MLSPKEEQKVTPEAVQSKAWVWSHLIARIAGSNPAESLNVCLLLSAVWSEGRNFCDGLITRLEESYACEGLIVCDLETSTLKGPKREVGSCATHTHTQKKENLRSLSSSPNVISFIKPRRMWKENVGHMKGMT